ENPFIKYKNKIILELEDDFEITEIFNSKIISNDRDKDLIISVYDIDFLVTCKYRPKANIRFNDVERTAANSKLLKIQGVIVTNVGYGKKAINNAKKYNIILTQDFNIKHKLKLYVDKIVEKRMLDILEDIEKEENI
ncbi:19018_t:CDS:1, partial [Dentiscutata erythropus]